MTNEFIIIRGYGSISALGYDQESVKATYSNSKTRFSTLFNSPVAALTPEGDCCINDLVKERRAYGDLDRSVLLAIYASRLAVKQAEWTTELPLPVSIGSSRGATGLFERSVQQFQTSGIVPPSTSPVTTLGNISSWVAQDLKSRGVVISHSVTL